MKKLCVLLLFTTLPSLPAAAADTVETRLMTLDLAMDIARHTLEDCRKRGHNIAVAVVDRAGDPQVVLRDMYVSRHAIELAQRKANAVTLSGLSSQDFRKNRADIRADLNEVRGILLVQGGLPIRGGGSFLGAVAVSGAPSDVDEACAAAGIKAVQERLDFIN